MLETETISVSESTSGGNSASVESDQKSQSTIEVESNEQSSGDKPKKKGGFQKRLEKQSKKIGKLAAERDFFEAELNKLRQGQTNTTQQVAPPSIPELKKPKDTDFETHQEYLDAYADWKFEAKERELKVKQQQEEAKKAAQTQLSKHQQRVEEFKKNNSGVKKDLSKFESMQHSPAAVDFIVESEHGPEIMLELAKAPEEYEKIRNMSYSRATKEMAKFELKFEKSATENLTQRESPERKDPKPINPIRSQGTTVNKSVYDEDLDFETYATLRNEQFRNSQTRR